MSPCQFIYHKGRPRDILASRDLFFLHHGQRGLLFDLHQISIDKSTLERLDSSWRTVSENTAEMSSTGEMTFLYMITSTRPITHWSTWCLRYRRQAWPNRDTARSRICFWFSGMERWVQVTSIKTLVSRELLTLLPTRAPAFFYSDKGSNAETSV